MLYMCAPTWSYFIIAWPEVKTMNWPSGPSTVRELMEWPKYNSVRLMEPSEFDEGSDVSAKCRQNFRELIGHQIQLHDAYSGSGTGSWTMHLQYQHMLRHSLICMWMFCWWNFNEFQHMNLFCRFIFHIDVLHTTPLHKAKVLCDQLKIPTMCPQQASGRWQHATQISIVGSCYVRYLRTFCPGRYLIWVCAYQWLSVLG